MSVPKIAKNLTGFWEKVICWVRQIDKRTNGRLGMLTGAARMALMPDSVIAAAAIAYFAVISLFPLTLLSIAIASFSLGPAMDNNLIIQRLEFIAPALSQLLGQNIDVIIHARGPVTGVALIGLIWSTSTIFFTLNQTMNVIWGSNRRRPVWKQRGIGILVILVFVGPALFLASFATSMIANLRAWLPNQIIPIGAGISFIAAILIDFALFMVLYIILPHGPSTWRDILPGAIWASLLWELAKRAFLLFISTYMSVSNLIYGSVAAIIAFLTWAYLSGLIFLFGAFLSVAYCKQKKEQQETPGN
jgi:membrane protein